MIFSLTSAYLLKIFGFFSFLAFLLYLLKLRERLIPVSSHFLWEKILKSGQRSLLSRLLRRFFSFLLQLLIIALAVLTLGKPSFSKPHVKSVKTLILLDSSASMKSLDVKYKNELISRWQKAKSEVKKIINNKSPDEQMLIVSFDSKPVPRSGWNKDTRDLLLTLEKIKVSDSKTNIIDAFRYALELLKMEKDASLILVSDAAISDKIRFVTDESKKTKDKPKKNHIDLSKTSEKKSIENNENIQNIYVGKVAIKQVFIKPGKQTSNVGIVALAARPLPTDSETTEVYVTIANFSKEKVAVRMDFYVDENWRYSETLNIKPNENITRLHSMALGGEILKVVAKPLGGFIDNLSSDNYAWAVLPKKSEPKILYAGEDNLFLEAALLLFSGYLKKVSADEYQAGMENKCGYSNSEECNILIFNEFVPKIIPKTQNQLYINPKGTPFKIASKRKLNYQILWTGGKNPHPIMKSVSMKDVNLWGESTSFKKLKNDVSLMQVDARGTILALLHNAVDGRRFVGLGFSLKSSDFVLQVSFPIFILNTINWFLGTSPAFLATYATGKIYKLHINSDKTVFPDMSEMLLNGENLSFQPEQVGVYSFYKNKMLIKKIAVSLLSANESNIAPHNFLVQKSFIKEWKPKLLSSFHKQTQIPWKKILILFGISLLLMFMTYLRGAWGALFAFLSSSLFAFDIFMLALYSGFSLWMAFVGSIFTLLILEWFTYNRRVTV